MANIAYIEVPRLQNLVQTRDSVRRLTFALTRTAVWRICTHHLRRGSCQYHLRYLLVLTILFSNSDQNELTKDGVHDCTLPIVCFDVHSLVIVYYMVSLKHLHLPRHAEASTNSTLPPKLPPSPNRTTNVVADHKLYLTTPTRSVTPWRKEYPQLLLNWQKSRDFWLGSLWRSQHIYYWC